MTPHDIRNRRFDKGMGGYKTDDVNVFLAEVADYVQDLTEEKEEMEKKMVVLAEKVEEYREDEESLRAALIGAQKLGDSVVRESKRKAEAILAEATAKASALVADARSNIDRETISFSKVQNEVHNFKNQILEMYRRQIEFIESGQFEAKTPPTVQRFLETYPPATQPPSAEKTDISMAPPQEDKEKKIGEFVLEYEEGAEPEDESGEGDADKKNAKNPKGHRTNYGNLRFGEEYNLTRNE